MFLSWKMTPVAFYSIPIEFSLIENLMGTNVLFDKSDCSGIIVKTTLKDKFSFYIFTSSLHIPLRNWIYVKALKLHCVLKLVIDIVPFPLTSLSEVRHQIIYSYSLIISKNIIILKFISSRNGLSPEQLE